MEAKSMETAKRVIFFTIGAVCLLPFVQPPVALAAGFLVSLLLGNPFKKYTGKITKYLLQASVVGLGFGMNIHDAFEVGKEGLLLTVCSISFTLLLGLLLGKLFKVSRNTGLLVSSGTAICGGSAIAAVAPIINASEEETSVSLGTIFILNSLALFIFPVIGELLKMTQEQFGLWAAIAIHDTSSVVGAAQKYGDAALQIATTVKLERALWIIPLSFVISLFIRQSKKKIAIPYFIFLYVAAMLVNTFVPHINVVSHTIVLLAKRGLTLTLFLIGASLTLKALKTIGVKPLLQGVLLWIAISVCSLCVILNLG